MADEMDREAGAIWLHRQLLSSLVWQLPDSQFKLFVAVLLLAQWKDSPVIVRGRVVVVRRGELLVSSRGLAERLEMSRGAIDRGLDALERLGVITRRPAAVSWSSEAGHPPTVVTVVNYDRFQAAPTVTRAIDGAIDGAIGRADKKKGKKGKKENLPPADAVGQASLIPDGQKEQSGDTGTPGCSAGGTSSGGDEPETVEHRAGWEMLERVYKEVRGRAYPRSPGQDAAAVKRIRGYADATMGEVERRWRRGLGEAGWLRCEVFGDLATHRRWAALAAGATAPRGRGAAVPVGDWGSETEFGNVPFNNKE